MPIQRRSSDLQGRRKDLGANISQMAIGLGISIATVREIERGTAAVERVAQYSAWLARMEAWSDGKRQLVLHEVEKERRRFNP